MNIGRVKFFQIKDLNTRASLCKNNFYPDSIKNDNGAVATRNIFIQLKLKQQLYQF